MSVMAQRADEPILRILTVGEACGSNDGEDPITFARLEGEVVKSAKYCYNKSTIRKIMRSGNNKDPFSQHVYTDEERLIVFRDDPLQAILEQVEKGRPEDVARLVEKDPDLVVSEDDGTLVRSSLRLETREGLRIASYLASMGVRCEEGTAELACRRGWPGLLKLTCEQRGCADPDRLLEQVMFGLNSMFAKHAFGMGTVDYMLTIRAGPTLDGRVRDYMRAARILISHGADRGMALPAWFKTRNTPLKVVLYVIVTMDAEGACASLDDFAKLLVTGCENGRELRAFVDSLVTMRWLTVWRRIRRIVT